MKLIFVGPDPGSTRIVHPGGQLTATEGFARFAAERNIVVDWVDTAQCSFPTPSPLVRLTRSLARLGSFTLAASRRQHSGVLLFAGTGMSFFERSLMVIVARLVGIPTVMMLASGHFRTFYSRNPLLHRVIRSLLNLPHRIAVQGESWQRYLEAIGVEAQRIAIVRNWYTPPVNPITRVKQINERGVEFIFVGWVTKSKGIWELLTASEILAREGRVFHLTIIGGGDLLGSARAYVVEKRLSGKISLPGWVETTAVPAYLATADVFVLPSRAEGLPNSLVEAMAVGLPAIATPVGAIPDTLQHGVAGTIVPVGDSNALAAAMGAYCDDKCLIERQSIKARKAIEALHDAETNCQAIIDLLALKQSPVRELRA
jgi:glycosyltransferase involved in cell wall biosynthesis